MSINLQKYEGTNVLTDASNPVNFGNGQTLSILNGGSFVAEAGSTINLENGNVTLPDSIGPIVRIVVKSVPLLTSGSPADIASVLIPSGITRYTVVPDISGVGVATCLMVVESDSGTLADSDFQLRTSSSGGGSLAATEINTISVTGAAVGVMSAGGIPKTPYTSSNLYIRQTANSAHSGTVSFYIYIYPLP